MIQLIASQGVLLLSLPLVLGQAVLPGQGLLLGQAVDPLEADRKSAEEPQLLLCRLEGPVTQDLVEQLRAQLSGAGSRWPRAQFIVFDLDVEGNDPAPAIELAEFISKELKGYTRVAWIPPGKGALSTGILIALAADQLVMGKDSVLGADPAQPAFSGEAQTRLREALRRAGSERHAHSLLTDAMISKEHEKVFRVRFARGPGNAAEEWRFKTSRDLDNLTAQERAMKRSDPEVVLEKGQLLRMTAEEALEKYGVIQGLSNDLTEICLALRIPVGPQNVIDLSSPPRSESRAVEVLNSPVARFFLLLVGCLAVLIELKTLGTMVPGSVALACFGVFFATAWLGGTASEWEILLFVIGVVLLAVEFLLLPGMAIFALSGAALCAVSLVLAMIPADPAALGSEHSMRDAIEEAISTLAFGFGTGSVCFLFLLKYLPHTSILGRRGLVSHSAIVGVPTADSALAAQAQSMSVLDRVGKVQSTLRPAGKVELEDGRVLDVVAEGEFIEKGTRVKVVKCDGGVTVVTRV